MGRLFKFPVSNSEEHILLFLALVMFQIESHIDIIKDIPMITSTSFQEICRGIFRQIYMTCTHTTLVLRLYGMWTIPHMNLQESAPPDSYSTYKHLWLFSLYPKFHVYLLMI